MPQPAPLEQQPEKFQELSHGAASDSEIADRIEHIFGVVRIWNGGGWSGPTITLEERSARDAEALADAKRISDNLDRLAAKVSSPQPVNLFGLNRSTCRFVIGDDQYCGNKVGKGRIGQNTSYCTAHHRIVYLRPYARDKQITSWVPPWQ